jgi:hypothetical protein
MRQSILYNLGKRASSSMFGVAGVAATAATALTITTNTSSASSSITRLEYWEHDPKDFDVYISNPTIKDLPILLHKFDKEGLEVWPWIWTHPNNDGPHHVFIGVDENSLVRIQQLRDDSNQNNILIIASEENLRDVASARNDPNIYERCQCGIVVDSKVKLLNHEAKILMLDDERVVAFDCLTLV